MSMDINQLQYWIGMAGTVAFAATAVLAVTALGIDLFGACVMGVITAIGGGTVRDVILDAPVFWSLDLNYIWVALAASFVTFFANRLMTRRNIYTLMLYIDGLAVALFAVQAAHKVWALNFGLPLAPILLGVITAIGGGLIRDLLAGRPTLLMGREIYAIPVTVGCTLYVALLYLLPANSIVAGFVCVALIFGFRAAVIHWGLQLPSWAMARSKGD
jgi:uncharacterized membrane protein YeiH